MARVSCKYLENVNNKMAKNLMYLVLAAQQDDDVFVRMMARVRENRSDECVI